MACLRFFPRPRCGGRGQGEGAGKVGIQGFRTFCIPAGNTRE